MRILRLLSCPVASGVEIYIRDMAATLRARGHDVTVAFLNQSEAIGHDSRHEPRYMAQVDDKGVNFGYRGPRLEKICQAKIR